MAISSLNKKLLGIALIVVGVGLLYWGYQKSEGFESQLTSTITGAQPDEVMLMYIAGAVCVAIGGFLNLKS